MRASYLNVSNDVEKELEKIEDEKNVNIYLGKNSKYPYIVNVTKNGSLLFEVSTYSKESLYSMIRENL